MFFQTSIDSMLFGSAKDEETPPPEELIRAVSLDETPNFPECDYDKNPTNLFKAIKARQWGAVHHFLLSGSWRGEYHPNEELVAVQVCTWVTKYETSLDGKDECGRWTQLPIHAALIFGAPDEVIRLLVKICPGSLRCADEQRMLPLHLAFRHGASDPTIGRFLDAFPEAIGIRDFEGRTPVESALHGPHAKRCENIQTIFARHKDVWKKKEAKLAVKQRKQKEKIARVKQSLKSKTEEVADLSVAKDLIQWREEKAKKVLLTLVSEVKDTNGWYKHHQESAVTRSEIIEDLSTRLASLQQVAEDLVAETELQANESAPQHKQKLFGDLSYQGTFTEVEEDNESSSEYTAVSRLSAYAKNIHMNHHIVTQDGFSFEKAGKLSSARSSNNQQSASSHRLASLADGSKHSGIGSNKPALKEERPELPRNDSGKSNKDDASTCKSTGSRSRVPSYIEKVEPTLTNSFSHESQIPFPLDPRTVAEREIEIAVAFPEEAHQAKQRESKILTEYTHSEAQIGSPSLSEAPSVSHDELQLPSEVPNSQSCDGSTNILSCQSSLVGLSLVSDTTEPSKRETTSKVAPIHADFNPFGLGFDDDIPSPDEGVEQHLQELDDCDAMAVSLVPVASESELPATSPSELNHLLDSKRKSKGTSLLKSFRKVTRKLSARKLIKRVSISRGENKSSSPRLPSAKAEMIHLQLTATDLSTGNPSLAETNPEQRERNNSKNSIKEDTIEELTKIDDDTQCPQASFVSDHLLEGGAAFSISVAASATADESVQSRSVEGNGWADSTGGTSVVSSVSAGGSVQSKLLAIHRLLQGKMPYTGTDRTCSIEAASVASASFAPTSAVASYDEEGNLDMVSASTASDESEDDLVIVATSSFEQKNGCLNPICLSEFQEEEEGLLDPPDMEIQGGEIKPTDERNSANFFGSDDEGIETRILENPRHNLPSSFYESDDSSQTSSNVFSFDDEDADKKCIFTNPPLPEAPLVDNESERSKREVNPAVETSGEKCPADSAGEVLPLEQGLEVSAADFFPLEPRLPAAISEESRLKEEENQTERQVTANNSSDRVISNKTSMLDSECERKGDVASMTSRREAFGGLSHNISRSSTGPSQGKSAVSRDDSEAKPSKNTSSKDGTVCSKFPIGIQWSGSGDTAQKADASSVKSKQESLSGVPQDLTASACEQTQNKPEEDIDDNEENSKLRGSAPQKSSSLDDVALSMNPRGIEWSISNDAAEKADLSSVVSRETVSKIPQSLSASAQSQSKPESIEAMGEIPQSLSTNASAKSQSKPDQGMDDSEQLLEGTPKDLSSPVVVTMIPSGIERSVSDRSTTRKGDASSVKSIETASETPQNISACASVQSGSKSESKGTVGETPQNLSAGAYDKSQINTDQEMDKSQNKSHLLESAPKISSSLDGEEELATPIDLSVSEDTTHKTQGDYMTEESQTEVGSKLSASGAAEGSEQEEGEEVSLIQCPDFTASVRVGGDGMVEIALPHDPDEESEDEPDDNGDHYESYEESVVEQQEEEPLEPLELDPADDDSILKAVEALKSEARSDLRHPLKGALKRASRKASKIAHKTAKVSGRQASIIAQKTASLRKSNKSTAGSNLAEKAIKVDSDKPGRKSIFKSLAKQGRKRIVPMSAVKYRS